MKDLPRLALPEPDFSSGLLPVVVQDVETGQVRMLGWMNAEAWARTAETRLLTFWSRSRQRLWQKGESSGRILVVQQVHLDCDRDAILAMVRPAGPTCHTGADSCFAGAASTFGVLGELERVIAERDRTRPEASHTATLLVGGPAAAARKVAEEGLETAFAAVLEGTDRLREEAADLLYHLLVLLRAGGVTFGEVISRLRERRRG